MITSVQVGDAVDDRRVAEWAILAANYILTKMKELDSTQRWKDNASQREVAEKAFQEQMCHLEPLPANLQYQVLSSVHIARRDESCRALGKHVYLDSLLEHLPKSLHGMMLAASWSANDPTLALNISEESISLIDALESLDTSTHSPFSSLDVSFSLSSSDDASHVIQGLAKALQKHDSITSLSFNFEGIEDEESFPVADVMQHLLPSLCALTCVQHVSVGEHSADCFPAFKEAFACMSQLQRLNLRLHPPQNRERARDSNQSTRNARGSAPDPGESARDARNRAREARKRARDGSTSVLPSSSLLGALSSASALTRLSLDMGYCPHAAIPGHCPSMFSLPSLRCLVLESRILNRMKQFVRYLDAPLSRIELSLKDSDGAQNMGLFALIRRRDADDADTSTEIPPLATCLSRFSNLKALEIDNACSRNMLGRDFQVLLPVHIEQ